MTSLSDMISVCPLWIACVPLPVCRFARTLWCRRFGGVASYGKDCTGQQTFYGFWLHAQLSWLGLLTHIFLAFANKADGAIVPLLLEGTTGVVLGDRNYWLPDLQVFLRTKDLLLQSLFRKAHS